MVILGRAGKEASIHPNEEAIRTMFAAYEAGDLDVLKQVLAENVVYHIPGRGPFAGEHRGRETMISLWDRQKEFLGGKPYHAEPYDMAVTDKHVIMLAEVTCERDGERFIFRTANVYHVATPRRPRG
ncbi:MAG: nuclear transport factor 2 family protein [Actinomycetota bacterium]|nr:nuclear transport factor 2 family protein [Actinomycetota bacterium]